MAAPQQPTSNSFKKLQGFLRSRMGQAIADYGMINEGDRVMVCVSGGKDSHTLLDILRHLQRHAPIHFDILAVNLDQKQPGFPAHVLPEYFHAIGVPYRIAEQDTYSTVKRVIPEGKTMCSLCSRLRRGVLYRVAAEEGATKIALGHHRDDMIETLFLNMFHGGRLKAMPPKLLTDDRRHIVIRPLAYCSEADIARYARYREFPIIPCTLCGSQANLQRAQIKAMLQAWEKEWPGRTETLFRSLQNIDPSQLADPALFDFGGLESARILPGDEDRVEDEIGSNLEAEFNPAAALFEGGLPPLAGAGGRDR
ncbi:tRNA 2-thiocytidine(32) synthetase TtcA [Nodosilinea sp. LEGE 07298]|uniref:tRNA 2-thiocytidine(32) synthetase TtcA n=1 Tax=Nodosilinea sp. LEGE 07298 TaxID=2777970 RepID=UPI00187F8C9A|nr:tRNA 2-thiocytidine(32) synthetase TtcA [Nodosilinea sp. LEGE 07298]MBE9112362.1 tRNA 2-thiocytidine(32) synthetase TtcA [Nodosilinea sp. LEGE 07298]